MTTRRLLTPLAVATVALAALYCGTHADGKGRPGNDPPSNADFSIVYSENESGSLFLSTADGSERLRITDRKSRARDPDDESATYSPSGRELAFLRVTDNVWVEITEVDLYLINADGTDEQFIAQLVPGPIDDTPGGEDTIAWSPTELEIVYASWHGIYAVELATGRTRQLADLGTPVSDVDISVMRGEMAFTMDHDIWRIPIHVDESGLLAPLNLADLTPVTIDGAGEGGLLRDMYPRYSPDGTCLAYRRNWDQLAIQHLATGDEIIVIPAWFTSEISWSPDGGAIVFRQFQQTDILIVDIATSEISAVTMTKQDEEHSPDWRPY